MYKVTTLCRVFRVAELGEIFYIHPFSGDIVELSDNDLHDVHDEYYRVDSEVNRKVPKELIEDEDTVFVSQSKIK